MKRKLNSCFISVRIVPNTTVECDDATIIFYYAVGAVQTSPGGEPAYFILRHVRFRLGNMLYIRPVAIKTAQIINVMTRISQ